jgi:DNA uptake protein ComE-like DNA-binding protein
MNNFFIEQLKDWFGFTRRERRATFIILILIICLLIMRYAIPAKHISYDLSYISQDTSGSLTRQEPVSKMSGNISGNQVRKNQYPARKERLIEINTCDSADLERLPGIGPVLSARIIKYRNLLGGYVSSGQLKEVYGLTPETFELISGRVFADSSYVKKININMADYKQLIRIPYLERYDVTAILKYRELTGEIGGIADLVKNKLITVEQAEKIKGYLVFGE